MNAIVVSLKDFPGLENIDPGKMPAAEVEAAVRRCFAFFPKSANIRVTGDIVTIELPEAAVADAEEAVRLCERAGKRAGEGNYRKAVDVYKRALELDPGLLRARRDLAMAYVELGEFDEAKNHLVEVLRLDPKNVWSWVILANHYSKHENDSVTAEKFYQRALDIDPSDAWALNGYAALKMQRGEPQEALKRFDAAIASHPKFANARYGKAVALQSLQQLPESAATLKTLFRQAELQDARSAPVFENARRLMLEVESELAGKQYPDTFKIVENYRAEVERLSGFPVRVSAEDLPNMLSGVAQIAWKHGRDHHLIKHSRAVPPPISLHVERKFWTNIEQAGQQGGGASTCWQPVAEFFSHVRSRLDEAERNKSADAKPYMEGLQAQFKEGFEKKRLIPSHSPRAKFLLRLAETDGAAVALYAVGFFLRQDIPLDRNQPKTRHECLRGFLAASYFDHNFTERIPNEKQALEELRAGWEKTFQEFQKSLIEESQKHRDLNSEATKLLDQQRQEFTELVTKERAEWTRLHKAYDESLALHKPVQYWTKKADTHRRLAWAFGIVATLVGGSVFALLYELIQITVRPPQGTADLANWHPEYWRIAVLVAAGLFGVWVVRIFVRMFLSNVHLLTDARERATMAQTYLALMRKGGLDEKDRQLILKALFRPAGTGLLKDDAMPLTLVESLTSLGKG